MPRGIDHDVIVAGDRGAAIAVVDCAVPRQERSRGGPPIGLFLDAARKPHQLLDGAHPHGARIVLA